MNLATKILIGAGAVGLVIWGAAKTAAQGFTFHITGYGPPSISNFILTIPLKVTFHNPTPIPVNVDQFIADIYVLKNNAFVKGARIDQPLNVPGGDSIQTIAAKVDIKSLFGGNLLDTLTAVENILASKTVRVKTDVTIRYGAVTLPVQTFTQDLYL